MSQDDLSSRENQRPPSRRSRSAWIISLNIAVLGIGATVFTGIALGGHHSIENAGPPGTASPAASTQVPIGSPTGGAHGSPPPGGGSAGSPSPQFSGTGASQYPCSDEGAIHSVSGGFAVRFSFVNDSPYSLQIIWLDYVGSRVTYNTVPSGDTYNVNTFTGNVWMVASSSASCLGIFYINGPGSVSISS